MLTNNYRMYSRKKTDKTERQSRKSHLLPIEPLDLFPDKAEREKWNRIKTVSSDTVDEQSSSFTAIAAKCSQFIEVKRAYRKIRALNPAANHVVAAYNLRNGYSGYQDDEEHAAGHKMRDFLQQNAPPNVAIFIVRIYGGIHVGPKHFQVMKQTAKQAIDRLNDDRSSP